MSIFVDLRMSTGIEYSHEGHVLSYPPWNPLHCVYCTSFYVAIFLSSSPRWLRTALAGSAVAVLVEQANVRLQGGEHGS